MIAKSYKLLETEILMTKNNTLYNVLRIVKGKESNITLSLNFEDANDIFDYYIDMEKVVEHV
jgi:hypothetical protein